MPESSSRNKKKTEKVMKEKTPKKPPTTGSRWVAPLMLTCWLLGLAWLVVFYIVGDKVPIMEDLHNKNLLIGMGLIAIGFVVSTKWV